MRDNSMIRFRVLCFAALLSLSGCSKEEPAAPQPTKGEWVVPAEAAQQSNPVRYDVDSVQAGRALFTQHCQQCHGYYGEGNGIVGAVLDQKPANLLQLSGKQEEGAFAWKIREGRGEMPSFRQVLSESEIWHIVNFVASLENEEGSLGKIDNPTP